MVNFAIRNSRMVLYLAKLYLKNAKKEKSFLQSKIVNHGNVIYLTRAEHNIENYMKNSYSLFIVICSDNEH